GLAFFVMLPWLKRTPTLTLDTDWLYRVFLPAIVRMASRILRRSQSALDSCVAAVAARLSVDMRRHRRPDGLLLRSWPTGGMALWAMAMLLAYLLLYYVR
ncbi:MAG: hypothetical protein KJZ90_06120, partial [Rhodocyclaceae bacterium]|nr:hypothetical protein [Rhodocyclaceae bacterium]